MTVLMTKPSAPRTSVDHIIKSFDGMTEVSGKDGWRVTFQNQEDTDSVIKLIEMLNGWKTTEHPHILHMIQIFGDYNA
jgi:hypothetical protein